MTDKQFTGNQFYQQKMNLLRHLLSYSEAMLNGLEEWEPIAEVLDQRDRLIDQLALLDSQRQTSLSSPLSPEQIKEMQNMLDLIRALDRETTKKMQEGQNEILRTLKSNVQKQKIIPYGASLPDTSGSLMDCRK